MKAFGHKNTFSTALKFYKHQISSEVLVSSGYQCCVNQPWWQCQQTLLKEQHLPTTLHLVTIQKAVI